ncbi:MAG: RNA polymerase sigma factor [Phycisphaerales bacterium]
MDRPPPTDNIHPPRPHRPSHLRPAGDTTPAAPPPARSTPHPDPHPDPDAPLIARHTAGDPDALGALLQRHADRLFRLCLRITGNRATAEELAQDAMVRIISAMDQFDARARFGTWITRITLNVCYTHLRREYGRRRPRQTPDDPADPSLPARPARNTSTYTHDHLDSISDRREPDPAVAVESTERHTDLHAALAQLDPEQRALLILRDQQDHDYHTLAEIFAVPEGTIKSRLFRARSALREALAQIHERHTTPDQDRGAHP